MPGITGMFDRRLDTCAAREGRPRGLHLGAYGYVEDLGRSRDQPPVVDPQSLPEKLRGPDVTVVRAHRMAGSCTPRR